VRLKEVLKDLVEEVWKGLPPRLQLLSRNAF
jgi:hypothetical protein